MSQTSDEFFEVLEKLIPNREVDAVLEFLKPIVGELVDIMDYVQGNGGPQSDDADTQLALDLIRAAKDAEAHKEIDGNA